MSAPTIILSSGQVLVTLSASVLGIYNAPGGPALNFGTIALVSDVSDDVTVGQSCQFDLSKSKSFAYGSTIYYIVNESDIYFKEIPVP